MTTPRPTNSGDARDVGQVTLESPRDTVSPEPPLETEPPVHDSSAHDQSNPDEQPDEPKPEKPFSIYTKREKCPLASALYFPAIPTMAAAFGKSIELINLTVTMYMVFQGISPMFWGILADRLGRRPVYLMCLTLLLLSCVGLALVPTNAYWLLMVLRCFQAAGSASTIALGAGVISDIATPAERGGFLGLFVLGPMLGPSMFWFLAIATGVVLVFMALTFPETLRAITGDGSKPPQKWNRTPLPILGRKLSKTNFEDLNQPDHTAHRRSPSPLQIFRVFVQPDVLMVLICTGILYAMFYSVTTTTAPLFMSAYPYLTQSTVGLCFIAYGVGSGIGSVVMGKILDYDWRRMEARCAQIGAESPTQPKEQKPSQLEKGTAGAHTADKPKTKVDKQDLPIEHTRLKRVPIVFFIEIGACIGYGWSVQAKAPLAVPLILQFIVGLMSMCIMTVNQTILIDMYPSQGSSITASNNFVRCLLGAGTISIQDFIINAINPGWTYVLFSGICMLTVPVFVLEWRYGATWRKKRAAKSS
ncbi:hypothetical protein FRC06_010876 [Ceratobasidium sp. 370]|nr:hypothetical protein FRC06_010876 [Ceratobasidium sp. 370]